MEIRDGKVSPHNSQHFIIGIVNVTRLSAIQGSASGYHYSSSSQIKVWSCKSYQSCVRQGGKIPKRIANQFKDLIMFFLYKDQFIQS